VGLLSLCVNNENIIVCDFVMWLACRAWASLVGNLTATVEFKFLKQSESYDIRTMSCIYSSTTVSHRDASMHFRAAFSSKEVKDYGS
jgi:hypothetical protein